MYFVMFPAESGADYHIDVEPRPGSAERTNFFFALFPWSFHRDALLHRGMVK